MKKESKEKKSIYDIAQEVFGSPLSEAGYEVCPNPNCNDICDVCDGTTVIKRKLNIKKELIDLLNSINLPENIEDKNLLDMFDSFKKLSRNLKIENQKKEIEKKSVWQICPKCSGQGLVSKPSFIAGDVKHWTGAGIAEECNLCNGKMIISEETGLPPSYKKK